MDPYSILFSLIKKYWWVVVLIGLLVYIKILHNSIESKDKTIKDQIKTISLLETNINSFKSKIDSQNVAIEELAKKGKEQASRLESAITRVNAMKPATQVIIREIYTDKTQDIEQLLLNALND